MKEKQKKDRPSRNGEDRFDIPEEPGRLSKRRERFEKRKRHEMNRKKRLYKDYEESE